MNRKEMFMNRHRVKEMFGIPWSKNKKYRCLFDFATQLREILGDDPDAMKRKKAVAVFARAIHPVILMYSRRIIAFVDEYVSNLDERRYPDKLQLLSSLRSILSHPTPSGVIVRLIDFFDKGPLKNEMWSHRLRCLNRAGELLDTDSPTSLQLELLEDCNGPGIVSLSAAAGAMSLSVKRDIPIDYEAYLNSLQEPFTDLIEEVEVDLSGSVSLVGGSLQISCGEIKSSSSNLKKAWMQLERTIRITEFLARLVSPEPVVHCVRISRVFVPIRASDTAGSTPPSIEKGISQYLHRV